MPLIDDLIEIGVDILNPIQPLPGLMDPEILKKRYDGERYAIMFDIISMS
jgi:hypothetical protein